MQQSCLKLRPCANCCVVRKSKSTRCSCRPLQTALLIATLSPTCLSSRLLVRTHARPFRFVDSKAHISAFSTSATQVDIVCESVLQWSWFKVRCPSLSHREEPVEALNGAGSQISVDLQKACQLVAMNYWYALLSVVEFHNLKDVHMHEKIVCVHKKTSWTDSKRHMQLFTSVHVCDGRSASCSPGVKESWFEIEYSSFERERETLQFQRSRHLSYNLDVVKVLDGESYKVLAAEIPREDFLKKVLPMKWLLDVFIFCSASCQGVFRPFSWEKLFEHAWPPTEATYTNERLHLERFGGQPCLAKEVVGCC